MYSSLNNGSINALMDDEPVIKYAIKQGQNLLHQLNQSLTVNMDLPLKKEAILN